MAFKTFFKKKYLLRFIGLGLFLFIIIFKVNLKEFYQIIKQINFWYLIVFVVVFLLASPIRAWRWQYILKCLGIKITSAESYQIVFFSNLLGLATPARIGEVGGRVSFFLKDKSSVEKVLLSIILEGVLDIIFLLLVASLIILFFIRLLPFKFGLVAIIILLIFLAIVLLVLRKKFEIVTKKIISFIIPSRFQNFYYHLSRFYLSFKTIGIEGYLIIFFLTFLFWLSIFFILYIFSKSLGLNLPFIYFSMSIAIASLVSLLPISISGLGTKEATYIILFTPLKISIEKIVAFSLASTLSIILLVALLGLGCWLVGSKKLNKLSTGSKNIDNNEIE